MTLTPNVLLIDDDPSFRSIMDKVGKKRDIHITTCASIYEVAHLENLKAFDMVVIDYYLDDLKGTEIAMLFGATPVLLMSSQAESCIEENMIWPPSVRTFVDKQEGPEALIETILKVHKRSRDRTVHYRN